MKFATHIFLSTLSIVGVGVGFLLTNSVRFGFCAKNEASCINFVDRIGDLLFYGSTALLICFVVLLFFTKAIRAWGKFAIWAVPTLALILGVYNGRGYFDPAPKEVYQWASVGFFLASLLIILIAHFRSRQ